MANDPINLYDYESRAKLVLPHNNWEFIEAGAMDEFTTRRNRSAFEDLKLRPRFLRDVSERNLSTTVLGQEISMPVMVAPAGSHMLAHPDGEVATARGTGMSDTLMMLSTSSNYSMEEVSDAAGGPLWFQLYHRGWHFTEMLVHRAEEAGFKAIVLTVDTPLPSPKERDLRNRYQRENDLGNFRGMDADRRAHKRHRRDPRLGCVNSALNHLEGTGTAAESDLPAAGSEGSPHRRGRPRGRRAWRRRHTGLHPRRAAAGHDHGRHRDGAGDCGGIKGAGRGVRGLRGTPGAATSSRRWPWGPRRWPSGVHCSGASPLTAQTGCMEFWNCCARKSPGPSATAARPT